MAITILSQPLLIEPVYSIDGNNLAFVVDSDDSALCSFKYIGKLNINNNEITTIKVSPNLIDAKGILSPNRVLEDFLSYNLHESTSVFQENPDCMVQYDFRLGEESDGTLDCSSQVYTPVLGPTVSGFAWNGTLQYAENYTFNDFIIGPAAGTKRFLTNAPSTQNIRVQENSYLYFLSGLTASPIIGPSQSPPNGYPLALEVVITTATSTATWYVIPNISITPNKIYSIGVGPGDINSYVFENQVWSGLGVLASDFIIDCNTISYTVKLTNYSLLG